jgi:hypothetical protein
MDLKRGWMRVDARISLYCVLRRRLEAPTFFFFMFVMHFFFFMFVMHFETPP